MTTMNDTTRRVVLRAGALWLVLASSAYILMQAFGAPLTHGAGGIEGHGLALITGTLMWWAAPRRSWHIAGALIHLWFGTTGIAVLEASAGFFAIGYLMTAVHFFLALLQLLAAAAIASARLPSPTRSLELEVSR